jgi:ribose transport system ATP-binding protein
MPEIIALADRIVVMDDYRVKGDIVNDRVYGPMSEKIMHLIHDRDAA